MDGDVPVVAEVVVAHVEAGVVGVHPQADRLVVVDVVPRDRRPQGVPELRPAGAAAGPGPVAVVVLGVVVADLVVGDGQVGDRDRVRTRIGLEPVLAVLGQAVVVEDAIGDHHHAGAVGVVLNGGVLEHPSAREILVDHALLLGGGEVLDGQILDGHIDARAGDGELVVVLAVDDRPGGAGEDVVVGSIDLGEVAGPECVGPGANQ